MNCNMVWRGTNRKTALHGGLSEIRLGIILGG